MRARTDDLVLFHGNTRVYAYGFLTAKMYWKGNTGYIWPTGENWDYLFAMRDFVLLPLGDRPESSDIHNLVSSFNRNRVAHQDRKSVV